MLKQEIYDGMIASMKRKDKIQTSIFRMINAEIKNEEIKQGVNNLSDESVIVVLKKLQKQMKESFDAFKKVDNEKEVNKLHVYLIVISTYLPKELNKNEAKIVIYNILDENKVTDFGKAMKLIMSKIKGQVNGKIIKEIVEEYIKMKGK